MSCFAYGVLPYLMIDKMTKRYDSRARGIDSGLCIHGLLLLGHIPVQQL
jgi:hypothetical protein